MARSKLVFVGRVNSIKLSSIKTTLSYVAWGGAIFHWILADVEVLEPFKGARKGEVVTTAMLSTEGQLRNPPGMLKPKQGDVFLLCLLPTPVTNVCAALTGPYDENLSILALHRSQPPTEDDRDLMNEFLSQERRFSLIFGLVGKEGQVLPAGAEQFRRAYAAELQEQPTNNLAYLEWETVTSVGGWLGDVPKTNVTATTLGELK